MDKIYYINLDKRVDRKEEIEGELKRMNLEAERYSAIYTPNSGIVGCGYSHLNVLKMARDLQLKNVLILEDDFVFLVDRETLDREIKQFFESDLGKDFDVLMIAYIIQGEREVPGHPNVKKVLNGQTASGYIVHETFYDKIIELYEWAIPLLEQTREHWNYANDHCWKILQPRSNWYAFTERCGKQRPGYSDNSGQFENHDC